LREAVVAEKPTLAFEAVEGRVPADRLAHAGHDTADEGIELFPHLPLPARHGCNVRLHGPVSVALRDLRVAPRKQLRFPGRRLLPSRLLLSLSGLLSGRLLPGRLLSGLLCHLACHARPIIRQAPS